MKTINSTGASLEGRNFRYAYDGIGNRLSTQTGGDSSAGNLRSAGYTPNALNQYTAITHPGFLEIFGKAPLSQAVTVNGLATSRQGRDFRKELSFTNTTQRWETVTTNGGSVSISQHHIPAASTAPTYDLDGNQSGDGQWTYTWDAENRLASATRTAAALAAGAPYRAITYSYDSQSRKISRSVATTSGGPVTTGKLLYDGWNCIAEYTGTSLSKTYLWGLDLSGTLQGAGGVGGLLSINDIPTNTTHYPCYDGNGNIRKLLDATTLATTATYDYGPFGELIRATGPYAAASSYRFSTKPQDIDTGLLDYTTRWYRPSEGRWASRDRINESGCKNLYNFVLNNGINNADYIGYSTLTVTVNRYARTDRAIFSTVTIDSDSQSVNGCCQLPKYFHGIERGVKETQNLLDSGTLDSSFDRENSPKFGPGNPTGGGLTSIQGRVAKHNPNYGIVVPDRPHGMNENDYNSAINNEFRTGDGGDNIHAGPNQNHSSGCVILGNCQFGTGSYDSYQSSIETDLVFKASVACAKRSDNRINIKTVVTGLPSIQQGPIIPKAIPVNP